jgi:DNA-binding transcriptional LysR family regulator
LGIAVLPCFMATGDPDLVALLPGESIQRSYWISSRRELHKSVRLRVLWDYVVELCAREQRLLLGESH